jgi:putative copper resistance protein D
MIDGAGGPLAIALRFGVLTATTLAIGGWLFARVVVPRAAGPSIDPRRAALAQAGIMLAMLGAAAVAMLAVPRVVAQARGLVLDGEPVGPMVLSVLRSTWGTALIAQAAGAAVLFVALRRTAAAGMPSRLADAGIMVLTIAPAFLGHAAADPEHAMLSVAVDAVHVAAAGGWIGVLAVLMVVVRLHRSHHDAGTLTAALIAAFHPVALACAGAVFATGLATAYLRMGAPEGIANSTYSGLFVAKVLLVGVTGAIGAGHAKLARRGATVAIDPAAVNRTLLGECLIALLVLALTSLLAGTSPIG